MQYSFALLVIVLFISGCTQTGQITQEEISQAAQASVEETNLTENQTQTEQITENLSFEIPSSEPANLPETQGENQTIEDLCANISCLPSETTCLDGYISSCQNTCQNGTCTLCSPSCLGHELPCQELWSCSEWSSCQGGQQTRACTDQNNCGTANKKPPETQPCEMQILNITITFVEPVEEWVEIRNFGTIDAVMTGWTLRDNTTLTSHIFTFPGEFILAPQNSVKIHKGNQTNTQTDLYWGSNINIWNNPPGHDMAILKDQAGNIISQYSY